VPISFPESPFLLHQPFEPAGDQPEAIAKLVEGIQDGLMYQTLLGVTGSGKTFTMANVIARLGRSGDGPGAEQDPGGAALLGDARVLSGEFRRVFRLLLRLLSTGSLRSVARSSIIEKDSSINEHIEQMRLSATKSLLERRDVVIVGTVSAIYGIGDPVEYHGMILHLREGEAYRPARRDQAPGRDAVRSQRDRLPSRNLPRARRRDRRLPGRARRVCPAASRCSTMRSRIVADVRSAHRPRASRS
jgi:excinuclease ABC subunit B